MAAWDYWMEQCLSVLNTLLSSSSQFHTLPHHQQIEFWRVLPSAVFSFLFCFILLFRSYFFTLHKSYYSVMSFIISTIVSSSFHLFPYVLAHLLLAAFLFPCRFCPHISLFNWDLYQSGLFIYLTCANINSSAPLLMLPVHSYSEDEWTRIQLSASTALFAFHFLSTFSVSQTHKVHSCDELV